MAAVTEIRPAEFVARWPNTDTNGDTILLDVREAHEIATASLPFSIHIPMNEIPGRLPDIDRDKTIVVMCHGGLRSMQVALYLHSQGFERVFNLAGGIDAWSCEVDPEVPRY